MTSTYKREGFVNDDSTYAAYQARLREAVERERADEETLRELVDALADHIAASRLWVLGDGQGGHVWLTIQEAVYRRRPDLRWVPRPPRYARRGPCEWCGEPQGCDRDHIVPRSRGGSDRKENRRWLCPPCNRFKGARLDEEISTVELATYLAGRLAA